jgi:parallel beta-helix repeat protein
VIQGNRVEGNGDTGIVVADSSAVLIAGNRVRGNGVYGLSLLDGAANNLIVGNTLRGNGDLDLFDDTTGRGTAGTANYYFRNSIGSASPDDLLGRGSGGGRGDDCDNGDDD